MNGTAIFTDSRGAVAVMVGICLAMLLGFGALTLDIGHALVTRSELQNVADAAALAGTRTLGQIYFCLCPVPTGTVCPAAAAPATGTPPPPPTTACINETKTHVLTAGDISAITTTVQNVAQQNQAAGTAIAIPTADIQIGTWSNATKTLTVTNTVAHAVRVRARRDGTANLPITTFLAGLMGVQNISVSTPATASLTGISGTGPGDLDAPFAISDGNPCNQNIRFYPTNSGIGCSGWTTYTTSPSNANTLRTEIDGMRTGSYTTPAVAVGDSLNFTGGNVASALPNLINLYNAKKDPATGFWDVFVPVYGNGGSCANPNGAMTIVGFASIRVTNVQGPPTQQIDAIVSCNLVEPGRGGGSDFGTVGSIPGLVQ